jgi:hypothetical protein
MKMEETMQEFDIRIQSNDIEGLKLITLLHCGFVST